MKIYLIFVSIHLLVSNCESARSTNPNCNFSNPTQRTEGGYPQITQQQCEALGNCFDDTIPNVNWCFRENAGKSRNPNCNFANPTQRVDGGWPQIGKVQCESLGYCFDDTIPNVKWCIKSNQKLPNSHCNFQNPQTRVDGGFPGISKKECVANGNCFDDSTPNTKWCFKYNTGRTQDRKCNFGNPQSRVDGGWPGISKNQCESSGNCFDDTILNVNFCFIPNSARSCHVL
ncbi:integumentary mucin C.1-like [Bradysia coprophila]|uniref:integumentary mucin C.1-like n=1 Tax=Bradysia coprophila TaxID=38358 RepID=UPI00187D8638|nr:integumentary mucin C.1-like [Bradysia coprophila]